jgi:hypothetical protein
VVNVFAVAGASNVADSLAWLGGTEHSNTEDKSRHPHRVPRYIRRKQVFVPGCGVFALKRSPAPRGPRCSKPACSASRGANFTAETLGEPTASSAFQRSVPASHQGKAFNRASADPLAW